MAWENQYIQLLSTKPGIIYGERDNDLSNEARESFKVKAASYKRTLVEFGSGSGMHLLTLAQLNPDSLCVGFEIRFKRAFKAGEKAERRSLANVAVLRADARQVSTLLDPETVDGFFVNYPDPWDKQRWLKNRLLNDSMIDIMSRLLKPGGFLRYKTDHHGYFESTLKLMVPERWRIDKKTTDLVASPYFQENIPTEFERLWRSQAKPLAMVEAVKLATN